MRKEEMYSIHFVKPLVECYGQQKFPAIRIKAIWEKLKIFPENLYTQCAERIILNHDNFPGIQAILNTCAEVGHEYTKGHSEELKKSVNCFRCRSQGVIIVNNFAYKCTCQLGELCYPAYAPYSGESEDKEHVSFLEDGTRVFENGSMISYTPPRCDNIRDVKTIIKNQQFKPFKNEAPEKARTEMKVMDFSGLLKERV